MKSRANRKTFVTLLALISMTGGAHALDMLSHRASYHASVQILRGDPATMTGEGFVEWTTEDHCDTWLFNEISLIRIGGGDDTPEFASNQVSFEAKDGSWYRYQNEFEGPGGAEFSSGEAVVNEADGPGRIVVDEPETLTGNLPVGAVFPMRFTIDVLERAATGERFMNHIVFDGMDGAAANEYTTFVQSVEERDGHVTWTMKVSIFKDPEDVGPDLEVTASIRDDGVIDAIRYEDETTITTLTLHELTELPPADC